MLPFAGNKSRNALPMADSSLIFFLRAQAWERCFYLLTPLKMMKTQTGNDSLECQLNNIIDQEPDTIRAMVAQEALDAVSESYPIESWFNDLLSHGCICGMISSLIYYQDTAAFFNKYYEDIMWLKSEYEESTGLSMEIPHQVKNHLAWFAFEETARQIADELSPDS